MSDDVNADDSWPLPWSDSPGNPTSAGRSPTHRPPAPAAGRGRTRRDPRRRQPWPIPPAAAATCGGGVVRAPYCGASSSSRRVSPRCSRSRPAAWRRIAYAKYNGQITRVAVLQTHDKNIRNASLQQNAENFLVIGSDSRAGLSRSFGQEPGARSDTTMIVHLSKDRHKATIISIPRDSWVTIPECTGADGQVIAAHTDMFNSAFTVGGPACTIATVQKLTGIEVTHFVEINFSGFESMVSALGRVSACAAREAVDDKGSGLKFCRSARTSWTGAGARLRTCPRDRSVTARTSAGSSGSRCSSAMSCVKR